MVSPTYGILAADAVAYLTGGGSTVPRSRGDALEIRTQSEQLCRWAKQSGHLIDFAPSEGPQSSGAEHEVFFNQKDDRVYKRTYPGTFGSFPTERGLRRIATPYFYLNRLLLTNYLFGVDMRLEGITVGEKPSVIISQRWAHAADIKVPTPDPEEIANYMTALVFERIENTVFDWIRKAERVRVSDARPDNFIKCELGPVPIDLVVNKEEVA